MVSSVCRDLDPHCPVADWSQNVLFPVQQGGEGGGIGFFPASCAAVHDSRRLAGLLRYPFFDQLVSRAALHAAPCRSHALVPWPSLCIAPWSITAPASICLPIQVGISSVVEEEEILPLLIGSHSTLPSLSGLCKKGSYGRNIVCLIA